MFWLRRLTQWFTDFQRDSQSSYLAEIEAKCKNNEKHATEIFLAMYRKIDISPSGILML